MSQTHLIAPSYAQCTWPIVACLREAERMLGKNRLWTPVNPTQAELLANHFPICRDIELDVVQAMASFSAHEVASWLATRGFPSTIMPFRPAEFGAASVLDVLLRWIEDAAERTRISVEETTYDGVKIVPGITFYNTPEHKHPIVQVPTRDSTTHVFMTIVDTPPAGEFGIVDLARRLGAAKEPAHLHCRGVIFPMIDLTEERALGWIRGMHTTNENSGNLPTVIVEARQMNRLRMNEEGVRAQSAVYMGFITLGGGPPSPYRIDKPFVLWIERDGLTEPLYAAWLDHDAWKDPGGLGLPRSPRIRGW